MRKVCVGCCREYPPSVRHCDRDGLPLYDVLSSYGDDAHEMRGRVLDGRYLVDALLGAGGMGIVLRAHHVFLDRQVAIKLLRPELLAFEAVRDRFFREARTASTISHPNVVEVVDFGVTRDDLCYLVMEYLEGVELGKFVRGNGLIELNQAVQIGYEVSRALAAIHAVGVVHRDLKPENIWLLADGLGDKPRLKVLDFGIAGMMEAPDGERLTRHGQAIGTPQYMSPEQCRGQSLDGRSDVYALGCILWELATGYPLFDGDVATDILLRHITEPPPRPSSIRPDVPLWFDELVMKCLAKDPGQRWDSARAVGAALGVHLARRFHAGTGEGSLAPVPVRPESARISPIDALDSPTAPMAPAEMQQRVAETMGTELPAVRFGNADPFLSSIAIDEHTVPSTTIRSIGVLTRADALALGGVDALLEVVFHWGGRYRYLGAEAEGLALLEAANAGTSVGRLFNRVIRQWPETETGRFEESGRFRPLEL